MTKKRSDGDWLAGLVLCLVLIPGLAEGGSHDIATSVGGTTVAARSFRTTDKFILGAALGYGFATEPLKPKTFYVKAVPGYFRASAGRDGTTAESEFDGYMLGGTVLYGFSEHVGVSLTGAFEQSTSGSAKPVDISGQLSPTLQARAKGYIIGASVVVDPFEGEGFRLPLTFGFSYAYYSSKVEGDFSAAGQGFRYFGQITRSSPGIFAGFAPQWNWGSFRLIPFGVVSESGLFNDRGDATINLSSVSQGTATLSVDRYREATYFAVGMTVKYRPWNLGLSYVRADVLAPNIDTNLFTLTWDRSW